MTHVYDPAGNRTLQVDGGVPTTFAYDQANQILTAQEAGVGTTTYTHDQAGNRTEQNAPGGITYYGWDEENQMTTAEPPAGTVTMAYNADGKRVQKQTASATTNFLYDFEKVLQETDGSGSLLEEYTATEKVYGDLLSAYNGSQTSHYEFDALGSTQALLSDTGSVADKWVYRAYGQAAQIQGTDFTAFTFVGKQGYFWDAEIELYFATRRHTDPATARWLSRDPAPTEPNLYLYCGNNPVNAIDPSGLGFLKPAIEKLTEQEQTRKLGLDRIAPSRSGPDRNITFDDLEYMEKSRYSLIKGGDDLTAFAQGVEAGLGERNGSQPQEYTGPKENEAAWRAGRDLGRDGNTKSFMRILDAFNNSQSALKESEQRAVGSGGLRAGMASGALFGPPGAVPAGGTFGRPEFSGATVRAPLGGPAGAPSGGGFGMPPSGGVGIGRYVGPSVGSGLGGASPVGPVGSPTGGGSPQGGRGPGTLDPSAILPGLSENLRGMPATPEEQMRNEWWRINRLVDARKKTLRQQQRLWPVGTRELPQVSPVTEKQAQEFKERQRLDRLAIGLQATMEELISLSHFGELPDNGMSIDIHQAILNREEAEAWAKMSEPEKAYYLALMVLFEIVIAGMTGGFEFPDRMTVIRQLGRTGEEAAQIVKNTQRIESLSGTATFRVPDELTATTLKEVKNVAKLDFDAQIRDSLHYSIMTNREFILVVRSDTQLSRPLQRAIEKGWIKLEYLP